MNQRSEQMSGQKAFLRYDKCRRLLETLSVVFCIMQGAATANAQTTLQRRTETYDDWTLSCAIPTGQKESCRLIQLIRSRTQIAQIAIGRPADKDTMRLSVEIPANVWLPIDLKLIFSDKKTVIPTTFRMCVGGSCIADADLTADQIEKLRAQTEPGNIEYVSAAQTDVSISVSFRGFVAAMDALKREQG